MIGKVCAGQFWKMRLIEHGGNIYRRTVECQRRNAISGRARGGRRGRISTGTGTDAWGLRDGDRGWFSRGRLGFESGYIGCSSPAPTANGRVLAENVFAPMRRIGQEWVAWTRRESIGVSDKCVNTFPGSNVL